MPPRILLKPNGASAPTTGENMKHKTMATYNSDDRKADLMVIVVCVGISIAIAVMAYFGWLPGGV
jgi:hypothetical protein